MRQDTVYASDALGTLARLGASGVQFWCVTPGCLNRDTVPIELLMRRCGPQVSMVMLARRARCKRCGRKGCHVQPAPPPAPGQPGYQQWVERFGGR